MEPTNKYWNELWSLMNNSHDCRSIFTIFGGSPINFFIQNLNFQNLKKLFSLDCLSWFDKSQVVTRPFLPSASLQIVIFPFLSQVHNEWLISYLPQEPWSTEWWSFCAFWERVSSLQGSHILLLSILPIWIWDQQTTKPRICRRMKKEMKGSWPIERIRDDNWPWWFHDYHADSSLVRKSWNSLSSKEFPPFWLIHKREFWFGTPENQRISKKLKEKSWLIETGLFF